MKPKLVPAIFSTSQYLVLIFKIYAVYFSPYGEAMNGFIIELFIF